MSVSRVALVTGGNKGIGLNICRQLVYKKWKVIMTARAVEDANKVLDAEFDDDIFPRQNVDVLQLDVTDASSIQSATQHIEKSYGSKIDILVNNAGIAYGANQFNERMVNDTLNTNYYGTVNVTKALLPYVDNRILFVSSRSGALKQYSKQRQSQFLDEDLTEQQLNDMVEEFKTDASAFNAINADNEMAMERKGWSLNAYAMSKASVSMYSRILARDIIEKHKKRVFVAAYCPGACRTGLTRNSGERSPVEGAYGISTLCSMLLDYEEDEAKRAKLNLQENDVLPFDVPSGCFWTAFYAKQGDLSSIELEPVDWVNPAQTLSWNNLLQNLVIRKGKGVLSIDEQSVTA